MIDTQALKRRVNVQALAADLLGRGKRSGKAVLYHAPWRNDDDTASFAVYADGYRDFGSGESGSGIDFIMRHLGLDFREAVDWLDDYLGGAGYSRQVIPPGQSHPPPETAHEPPSTGWQQACGRHWPIWANVRTPRKPNAPGSGCMVAASAMN